MENNYFSGLDDISGDYDAARRKNAAHLKRAHDFREMFAKFDNGNGFDLEAIRRFCFDERKLEDFQSAELMRIYTAFRQLRSFEDMIRLYEASDNEGFTGSQIVKEFYAVACNHTGRYDKAIETAEWLLTHGDENGEVYGTLGKAFYKKYEICKDYLDLLNPDRQQELVAAYVANFPDDPGMEYVKVNAYESLRQSSAYYEAGFLVAFESYPGINAVYAAIELGDIQKAKSMARLVHLACLRDGARDTMDRLCAATLMEAACIMGGTREEIAEATEKFLSLDVSRTRLQRTINVLERMKRYFHDKETPVRAFDQALDRLHEVMEHHGLESFNHAARKPQKDTLTDVVRKISSSYRGMASNFLGGHFVPGNFMFGGQLPDHYLTRTDWQQFQKLLDMPIDDLLGEQDAKAYAKPLVRASEPWKPKGDFALTLKHVYDVDGFMMLVDKIVRRAFNTDKLDLEKIDSQGHFEYDEMVAALLRLSGGEDQKNVDSRTNISVIMGLGLGDCRQHAQAKQILFDAWQKYQMNDALRSAYAALSVDKNPMRYRECIEKFRELERIELRTFDTTIMAPIQVKEKYAPVRTEDGLLKVDGDGSVFNVVESHTLTCLLRHNKKGELQSLSFADSFYHRQYEWGSGNIPLDQLSFDAQGQLIIPAKTVKAVDAATGEMKQVPVKMIPTRYAGKKDQISRDEHGQLLLLGIPVEKRFDLAEQLKKPYLERVAALSAVRLWYLNNGGVPKTLVSRTLQAKKPGATPDRPRP